MKKVVYLPCEDWFLLDRIPKYLGPRETPVVPWEYHKMLNPKYNLDQQAQAAPKYVEKYERVYRRVDLDGIWMGEEIERDVVYYVLYELI